MIENLVIFIVTALIVAKSKKKRAIGWLVLSYYSVYIIIALDFFGFVTSNIFTTYNQFMLWYLIYTSISFIFFFISLLIYKSTGSRTAIIYAIWVFFNMIISGVSAVFQSFETNAFLIVYNIVQNFNLIIDLLVVVIGTDNPIRNGKRVSVIIDRLGARFNSCWLASNT